MYPLPTTENASALCQLIKLIESAPDIQHLDMIGGSANSFNEAEGLKDSDNKDYGNMMALYPCLMAKHHGNVRLKGPSTSSIASVGILESQASTMKFFKLHSALLLSEHRSQYQPDQQEYSLRENNHRRVSPITSLEQVNVTQLLDPEIEVILEECHFNIHQFGKIADAIFAAQRLN